MGMGKSFQDHTTKTLSVPSRDSDGGGPSNPQTAAGRRVWSVERYAKGVKKGPARCPEQSTRFHAAGYEKESRYVGKPTRERPFAPAPHPTSEPVIASTLASESNLAPTASQTSGYSR